MKKAFTFLELVIVIVIIGILSGTGADIFLRIYNTYFESRTQNEIQAKTQLAMDQIANRLTYRIKPSVIVAQGVGAASTYTSIESAGAVGAGTIYRLEWVAYDNDSFRGMATDNNTSYIQPGWSGFIDLDSPNSDATSLSTPGGNTTSTASIVNSLSYNDINFSTNAFNNNIVMIFPDAPGNINQYGWYNNGDFSLTHPVYRNTDNIVMPVAGTNFSGIANEVYENYQLAYTAYALEYNPNTKDLRLYYNYQPWNGELYNQGNNTLFLDNVSNFIFTQVGSMLKVQICVTSNYADNNYSLCKERAIF